MFGRIFSALRILLYSVAFLFSTAVLLVIALAISIMTLPDVGTLEKCITTTMYHVHLCPDSDNYVKLTDISSYVLHAVIAAEDGSFYSHNGFDWHELRQSMNTNLQTGGFRRGGSTLTQQLAKNVFLDKEKSLWRKLKEAYLAHAIEHRFNKNFILEKYLNVVEFGPDIYGIKAAAQFYFHKSPSALHPLEAAYLAMLLPNPKKYSQSFRAGHLTPFARKMVSIILKRMQSFGKLSPSAYQTAIAQLDNFPWKGIALASFSGNPGYDLEPTGDMSAPMPSGEMTGENALEQQMQEDERDLDDDFAIPAAPPPVKKKPAARPMNAKKPTAETPSPDPDSESLPGF